MKIELVHGYLGRETWSVVLWVLIVGGVSGMRSLTVVTWWWIIFVVTWGGVAIYVVFRMVRGDPAAIIVVAPLAPTPVVVIMCPDRVRILWWMCKPIWARRSQKPTVVWRALRTSSVVGIGTQILSNLVECTGELFALGLKLGL